MVTSDLLTDKEGVLKELERRGYGNDPRFLELKRRIIPHYVPEPGEPQKRTFGRAVKENLSFEGILRNSPFLGSVISTGEGLQVKEAANRLANNPEDYSISEKGSMTFGGMPGPEMSFTHTRKSDQDFVDKFIEKHTVKSTLPARAVDIVAQMPAYATEFAATGGVGGATRKATVETGTKYLVGRLNAGLARTAAKRLVNAAGWAAAGTVQGTLMPQRALETLTTNEASQAVGLSEKQPFATNVLRSYVDTLIQATSERAGGDLFKLPGGGSAVAGALKKLPLMGKLMPQIEAAWVKATGNPASAFVGRMVEKGGFNGVLEEMGEERLATIMSATLNKDDFGASQRLGRPATMMERLEEGISQDIENMPAEFAGFLAVPAGQAAAGAIYNRITRPPAGGTPEQKVSQTGTPPPASAPLTPDQVDNAIRTRLAIGQMGADVTRQAGQVEDADTAIRRDYSGTQQILSNLQKSLKDTPEGQILQNLQAQGAAPEVITKEYTEEAFQRAMEKKRARDLEDLKKGVQNVVEEPITAPGNANVSESGRPEAVAEIRPQAGRPESSTGVPGGGQERGQVPGKEEITPAGYDGLKFNDKMQGKADNTSYAAFYPEQVKIINSKPVKFSSPSTSLKPGAVASLPPQNLESEDIFIREITAKEKGNPQRAMMDIPSKDGYKVVYKPYGEQGKGFYYTKIDSSVTIPPMTGNEASRDITPQENAGGKGEIEGSRNAQIASINGMIVGNPKYASFEPHHIKKNGGAWVYENFYNPNEEKSLIELFDSNNPVKLENQWVEYNENTDKYYLVKQRGNQSELFELNEDWIEDFTPDIETEKGVFQSYNSTINKPNKNNSSFNPSATGQGGEVTQPSPPPQSKQPLEQYTIGPEITYESKTMLGQVRPDKFPAHEVKLSNQPSKELIVYKVKGGWIIRDKKSGEVFKKGWKGKIYEGFDTPKEAIDKFLAEYPELQSAEAKPVESSSTPVTKGFTEQDVAVATAIKEVGGDVSKLTGSRYAGKRQHILDLLTGKKHTKAVSGINNLMGVLFRHIKAPAGTSASRIDFAKRWVDSAFGTKGSQTFEELYAIEEKPEAKPLKGRDLVDLVKDKSQIEGVKPVPAAAPTIRTDKTIAIPKEELKPKGTKRKVGEGEDAFTITDFGNNFGVGNQTLYHISNTGVVKSIVSNDRAKLTDKERLRLMQRLIEKGIRANVSSDDFLNQILAFREKDKEAGVEEARYRDVFSYLSYLAQSEPELGEQFVQPKKFDVTYVSDGVSKHRPAKSLEEMKTEIGRRLKKLATNIPEFKKDAAFVFDKDGMLSYSRGGTTIRFYPKYFGLKDEVSEDTPVFTVGDTIPVDLESFGIDTNITSAEKKAITAISEDKPLPPPATTGKDIEDIINTGRTQEEVNKEWNRQRKWEDRQVPYHKALDRLNYDTAPKNSKGVVIGETGATEKNIMDVAVKGKKAGRTKDAVIRSVLQATKDASLSVKDTVDMINKAWEKAPEPPSGLPKSPTTPRGQINTVFTAEAKDAALERQAKKSKVQRKARGGPSKESGQIQTFTLEDLKDAVTILGYYAERGIRTAADFTGKALEVYGEPIRPHIPSIWNEVKSTLGIPDEPVPPTPVPPSTTPPRPITQPTEVQGGTSVQNAAVAERRASLGLPPLQETDPYHDEEVLQNARNQLRADPLKSERLLSELRGNVRPVSVDEEALLLHRMVVLENQRDLLSAQKLEAVKNGDKDQAALINNAIIKTMEDYHELTDITKAVGRDLARALRFRQRFVDNTYTLIKMEHTLSAALGRPLNEAEMQYVADLQTKLAQANTDLKSALDAEAEAKKKLAEVEAQKFIAEERAKKLEVDKKRTIASSGVSKSRTSEYGSTNKLVSRERYEKVRAELRERLSSQINAGLDPRNLEAAIEIGVYHIEALTRLAGKKASIAFEEWSKRMQDDLGDGVLPMLNQAWEGAHKQLLDDERTDLTDKLQSVVEGDEEADADFDKKDAEIGRLIKKIAANHIASGVSDLNKVVDLTLADIQDIIPEMTWEDVLNTFADYGKYRPLDKSALKEAIRDKRRQALQLSKLFALFKKQPLKKTGLERGTPSDEERELIQLVYEAKKQYGIETTDPETQLKSALDAVKTRLRNEIVDLEKQIVSREKTIKERAPLQYDEEALRLKERRDALKTQFNELFADPQADAAKKVAMAMANAKKSLKYYSDLLRRRSIETKAKSTGPTTPELEALRQRRNMIRREVIKLRNAAKPKKSIEERVLERLDKRKADYESRLSRGDYSTKPRKAPFVSQRIILAQANVERLKREFDEKAYEAIMKNKPLADKIQSFVINFGNVLKSLQYGGEVSAIGRQMFISAPVDFGVYATAVADALKAWKNPDYAKEIEVYVESHPLYRAARTWGNIQFTTAGIPGKNEFIPSRLPEKIPVLGEMYRRGDAAFNAPLNKQRLGLFEVLTKDYVERGELTPDFYIAPTASDIRVLKRLGGWINDLTGRSGVGRSNAMRQLFTFLNYVGGAPRYTLAKLKLVSTGYGAARSIIPGIERYKDAQGREHLKLVSNFDRILLGRAVKGFTKFAIFNVMVATAAYLANPDDNQYIFDPRSSDFMKVRSGNQRYDFTVGIGAILRLFAQLATGKRRDASGRIQEADWWFLLEQFAKSKEAPLMRLVIMLYTGKDFVGKPISKPKAVWETTSMLFLNDAYDSYKNSGLWAAMTAFGGGAVGVGVQSYPETANTTLKIAQDEISKNTYGKPWMELSDIQQTRLRNNSKILKDLELKKKQERDLEPFEYQQPRSEFDAGQRIFKSLSTENQKILTDLGIKTVNIGHGIGQKGFRLNDKRFKVYEEEVIKILTKKSFKGLRKEAVENRINTAREIARGKVLRQIRQGKL